MKTFIFREMYSFICSISVYCNYCFLSILLLGLTPIHAAVTWDGGGSGNNWSTGVNWDTDTSPVSGNDVTFTNTDKTASSVINSVVDTSYTTGVLTFNNTGTTTSDWQYLQIASGATLTVNGGMTVGGIASTGVTDTVTTQVKISGTGTLVLGNSSKRLVIANTNSASSATATSFAVLDLSGLSTFNAWASDIRIGYGQEAAATFYLAQTNKLKVTGAIYVGNAASSGGGVPSTTSYLYLGQDNSIYSNSIYVGSYKSSGTMMFQSGISGGSITIRAYDETSRASMTVGNGANQTYTTALVGTADFTGGSIFALLSTLTIGQGTRGSTYSGTGGGATGIFSMSAGGIDATSIILGQTTDSTGTESAGTATGTLNISGGWILAGSIDLGQSAGQAATGVLNISGGSVETLTSVDGNTTTGNITMGSMSSTTSTAAANATINLTGGTLTVGGNIAEGTNAGSTGTVTSTVNLSGGTLDMQSHSVTVDHFNVQSGTLKNLGQFNSGATLVKSTTGTLNIEGANDFTGGLRIDAGTVRMNGSLTSSSSSVTVKSGGTLGGSGGSIAGAVSVENGGYLDPGASLSTTGIISVGGLSMQSGAEMIAQINGTTAGSGYDQVSVTGSVNLNSDSGAGSNLVISMGTATTVGQTYTLILNDGGDAISGVFATVNGASFGVGNTFTLTYGSYLYTLELFYAGGDGNDLDAEVLSIAAIPEAPMALYLGMSFLGLLMSRKLKSRFLFN